MKPTKDGKSTARLDSTILVRLKATCALLGLEAATVLEERAVAFCDKHAPKTPKQRKKRA